ncbi:hypothetical protein EDE15_4552 [Edaphobacter aggregans]|jgi:hypothetical protein|uniref:Uncharacterized protein n=1 Tax=Edaphobacter aggregans TaxID=570835 RepID=A0A3R9PCZ0_9BACT|nr:hypothetical protein EDE15_4552 [Edaphobacter aggregans]
MSKKARIQQTRLEGLESEFQSLLIICLIECSKGRYGLFGQNSHLDLEDRYWKWSEAKHLRTLAADIRLERSKAGEASPLCDKFLSLCEARDSNTPGEPRLAATFLGEMRERS